jgi:hypothetical protein
VNQILCCITWRPDWDNNVVQLADEQWNNHPFAAVAVNIAAGEQEHLDNANLPHLHKPHMRAMK